MLLTEVHDTTFAVWETSTDSLFIFNDSGDLIFKTKTDCYRYHNVRSIYEDRLSVLIDGKRVLIDSKGNTVKSDAPNLLTKYLDGLAIADWGAWDYHYYDRNGNIVNPGLTPYPEIYPLKKGRRLFRQDGSYGFVNENAEICIPPTFPYAHSFSEGLAVAADYRGSEQLWGYIDLDGNWAIEPLFTYEPGDFHDGYAVVRKKNGRFVYINKQGEVCSGEYSDAKQFCDGKARVYLLELVQYYNDWYSCAIIDTSFRRLSLIGERMFDGEFCENTKTYYDYRVNYILSSSGKTVLKWSSPYRVEPFYHNLTIYSDGTCKGYINIKGEIVLRIVENEF